MTIKRVEQLLKEKDPGTFLLHFLESNGDAAITFSWVDHDSNKSKFVCAKDLFRNPLCTI